MAIPEREFYEVVRELHRWLRSNGSLAPRVENALQRLYSVEYEAALRPLSADVRELVRGGEIVEAIGLFRDLTGCSVVDAGAAVNRFANVIGTREVERMICRNCGAPTGGCAGYHGLYGNFACESGCEHSCGKADATQHRRA